MQMYELFRLILRISERRVLHLRCGAEVSAGKRRCPLTLRRAIGPLDTLLRLCYTSRCLATRSDSGGGVI